MIGLLVSLLLDLSHCGRWVATERGPRCAEVRLRAPLCVTEGWHRFGFAPQRILVCVRGCGAEAPSS